MSGPAASADLGNCLPLRTIPVGIAIHNIELHAGIFERLKTALVRRQFCHIGLEWRQNTTKHLGNDTDADTDEDEQKDGEIIFEVHGYAQVC